MEAYVQRLNGTILKRATVDDVKATDLGHVGWCYVRKPDRSSLRVRVIRHAGETVWYEIDGPRSARDTYNYDEPGASVPTPAPALRGRSLSETEFNDMLSRSGVSVGSCTGQICQVPAKGEDGPAGASVVLRLDTPEGPRTLAVCIGPKSTEPGAFWGLTILRVS